MKTKIEPIPVFTATKDEELIIKMIATRAVRMAAKDQVEYDMLSVRMDLEACHCNGTPLDLSKLLKADPATFGHDVYGIRRYMDRTTGKLTDCFLPRCSK